MATWDNNTAAFVTLVDRSFGEPGERVEVSGPDGQPIQVIKPW